MNRNPSKIWLLTLVLSLFIGLAGCNSSSKTKDDTPQNSSLRQSELSMQLTTEALDLLEQGQTELAEAKLKAALEADLTNALAHNNLGKIYFAQKKYYQAAWEFEYAVRLQPDRAEPRNNLGLVFETVGQTDDAVDYYRQAIDLAPKNADIAGNLARAKLFRGDRDPQLKQLLQLVAMKHQDETWQAWATDKLNTLPFESN